MINELVRAMLLTIRNSEEYEHFTEQDQKRLDEIMKFVGGEEIDSLLEGIMNAPEQHYQIKITLQGAKPPIWRRVIIPADYTFEELHLVIQESMGWMDMHLYSFECDNFIIEDLEFNEELIGGDFFAPLHEKLDASEIMVGQLFMEEGDKCVYTYDFGDNWKHKVVLEKILEPDEERQLPVCLKGKRACPPEDCGGIYGYEDMIAKLAGPDDEEKAELLEWIGEEFEPERFDIDVVNSNLKDLGNDIDLEQESPFFR